MPKITDRAFPELTTSELHDIIRLRNEVFIVEIDCCLPELDGRDTEPSTRHVWIAADSVAENSSNASLPVAADSRDSVAVERSAEAPLRSPCTGLHDIHSRDAWMEMFMKGLTDRPIAAYARVLEEPEGTNRIGRVVTHPTARHRGLATQIINHILDTTDGPWVLGAMEHLAGWYAEFGFQAFGDPYSDWGLPHVHMRLDAK